MSTAANNNKRIAKNTGFLYVRMLLNMAITFYTSRVVLNTLGVEDFGTYGVVGGIITMFGFLNSSMAGATSRFLTFELGKQDYERLKKTFSASLTIHFIIAVIILILSETVGLWWLENKLIITPERMMSARWVFHLSVLASTINITQVPYNATIIAHERMDAYAYIEILNSLLKLGIVFLLVLGNFDKLILYAVLVLFVTILITIIYRAYCVHNFNESRYKYEWDKEIIKPMLGFSGWNLCDNMVYTARTQGVNILLNMFFGVVLNTAYGIAFQVQGAVQNFSNNFLSASRPQIVKYYAVNDMENMQNLMINIAKFSFLLMYMLTLPLLLETHFVLKIWLVQVPDYSVLFSQFNLIGGLLGAIFTVFIFGIHATGKIKKFTIIASTIYIMIIPISYLFLKAGYTPIVPYIVNLALLVIGYFSYVAIFHSLVPKFSIYIFFKKVILPCLLVIIISTVFPLYLFYKLEVGWFRFILIVISSISTVGLTGYFILLNKDSKAKILLHITKVLK